MKVLISLFVAILVCSTAQSESFVDISYTKLTDLPDGVNADGYSIMYSSVEDNITLQGGYMVADITDDYGYGVRDDVLSFGGEFGMQSFATGTFYAGAGLILADGDNETSVSIGYSKRKVDELSYDLAISHSDGESVYGATMRIPVANGGGILMGVADSDSSTAFNIGYSFGF
jgi:hypothetical protein